MVVVTALYGALLALLVLVLAGRVAWFRKTHKLGIGGQDNLELQVLVRAHANAVENIPIALLLLLCAELNGVAAVYLHGAGVALVLSRIAHAHGFVKTKGRYSVGRFYGTVANWLLVVMLAVTNIVLWASKA